MLSLPLVLALLAASPISTVNALPDPSTLLQQQQQPLLEPNQQHVATWRQLTNFAIGRIRKSGDDKHRADTPHPQDCTARAHLGSANDVLLRFNISNTKEAAALSNVASYMFLDVWGSSPDKADIRVAKDSVPILLKALPEPLRERHSLLLDDRALYQAIQDTLPSAESPIHHGPQSPTKPIRSAHGRFFDPDLASPSAQANRRSEHGTFFDNFQSLSAIEHWLRLIASHYGTHVRLVNIGTSAHGRPITGVRIGVEPHNSRDPLPPRKTVLILGGLSARDWISTSSVTYLIHRLATGYGRSQPVTELLHSISFVLIPTLNPDGYAYTWSQDRLWHKSRQAANSRICTGFSLAHSFPVPGNRPSTDPCSTDFGGDGSGSGSSGLEAIETRALTDWVASAQTPPSANSTRAGIAITAVLDLQTPGRKIIYPSLDPYPPSPTSTSSTSAEAAAATAKLATRGSGAGGSAVEYFSRVLGTRRAYEVRLLGAEMEGFVLAPPGEIVPVGRGVFALLMRVADAVRA